MQLVLNRLGSFASELNRKDVKQNRLQILLISLETGAISNLTKQVTAAQRWAGPSDRLKHIWTWSAPQRCGSAPHAAFDMTVLTAGPNKTGGLWCAECVCLLVCVHGVYVCFQVFMCAFSSHTARLPHCAVACTPHPPTSTLNTSSSTCFPFWF